MVETLVQPAKTAESWHDMTWVRQSTSTLVPRAEKEHQKRGEETAARWLSTSVSPLGRRKGQICRPGDMLVRNDMETMRLRRPNPIGRAHRAVGVEGDGDDDDNRIFYSFARNKP